MRSHCYDNIHNSSTENIKLKATSIFEDEANSICRLLIDFIYYDSSYLRRITPDQKCPTPTTYLSICFDLIDKTVLMAVLIYYRNQLEIEGLANGVAGVYGVLGCEDVPFSGPLSPSLAVAAGDVVLVVSTFMTYRYPW